MKNRTKKICLLWSFLLVAVLFSGEMALAQDEATKQVNQYAYENFEKIPGQERTSNFVEYLQSLYKFGVAISAILAIFMISFGAFIYIVTSAGNASKMADAKDMIFSAIFGLILALVAFLILYLINPDLVSGVVKQFTKQPLTQEKIGDQTVTTSNKHEAYNAACPKEKQADPVESQKPIDFAKAPAQPIYSKCNQYDDLFNRYGSMLDSSGYEGDCILKTIAHMESSCNPNAQSSAGACGLMQLLPSTSGEECENLKKNPELSVKKATEYIAQNMNGAGVSAAKNKLSAIFAGYNSGYGTGTNSDGKKGGLAESSDCPGARAFECCKNPGELDETIAYAWKGVGLYLHCVGGGQEKVK